MTHLDNAGEVGLGWPGLAEWGWLTIPPSLPENQAGSRNGLRGEAELLPLNPMLCPPFLCPLCQAARQGASLPSPLVWFGQSPRTRVTCSWSLPPCC